MNATLQETAPCQKKLTVEVPRETVEAEFQVVYRELKKKAHVPGFRVGSAPQDLLQRYHGTKAREEVLRRLIGRTLDEALEKQGRLDLVGRPHVTEVKLEANQPLTYTAEFEVAPQLSMGRYKGLKLSRPKADVSEENVGKILEYLSKARNDAPLDDAFAKSVGPYETLEALKEAIRQDLKRQADAAQRQGLESQALTQLIEEWEFDVPPSLVASQARRVLKERAIELLNQGVPQTQLQERAPLLTDQAKVDALKQVKLFFVLRRIASAENFNASEEEVNGRVQALAQRLGTPVEEVRKDLESKDLLEEIAWGVIRAKVLDLILKEAQIKEA